MDRWLRALNVYHYLSERLFHPFQFVKLHFCYHWKINQYCVCSQSCSNCQDLNRCCCLLHIWTAVLRVRRNYVEQHQGQIHQAPRPRRLHHEDHHGHRVRVAGRGRAHHCTLHGRHWRLLLLHPWTYRACLHRSYHLLGYRLWTFQIHNMEERSSTNLWSLRTRVRHQRCHPRHHNRV